MDYREAREGAFQEIRQLLEERARIDARINLLKSLVTTYSNLLDEFPPKSDSIPDQIDEEVKELGITRAIRQALEASKIPLSAPEIRLALDNMGFGFSQYANAGAVIHNTLTRLVKQGEVMRVNNPAGQTVGYALVRNAIAQRFAQHLGITRE